MKNIQRVILITIIILAIISIILLGILLKNIKKQDDIYNTYEKIDEIEPDEEIQLVKNHNQYYSVLNTITGYYMHIGEKEQQKVYNILDEDYIDSQNITDSNVLDLVQKVNSKEPYYVVKEMYIQDSNKITSYYVYGNLKENMFDDKYETTYLIVYVDNYNSTYSIKPINKSEYQNNIKTGKKLGEKQIQKNDNNTYQNIIVNDETITTQLLYDYKSLTNNNISDAFNKLDTEYKKKKFNDNIEEYKEYINNSNIKYSMLSKYQKNEKNNYTEYICIDQNGRYYILKETAVMQYTVILDTYTIDLPEFTEKYNSATDENKVLMNIQKVFDAINDGDYKYVYNKLDPTFRTNNFKTLTDFENYVKKNFFSENKLASGKAEKQSDIYLYNIIISDASGKNTNTVNKTFVMQLKEGTDFVMSFNVK